MHSRILVKIYRIVRYSAKPEFSNWLGTVVRSRFELVSLNIMLNTRTHKCERLFTYLFIATFFLWSWRDIDRILQKMPQGRNKWFIWIPKDRPYVSGWGRCRRRTSCREKLCSIPNGRISQVLKRFAGYKIHSSALFLLLFKVSYILELTGFYINFLFLASSQ